MGEHIVRVVEDGALEAEPGWAVARSTDGEQVVFIVRESSASSEQVLTDAWEAARRLENELLAEDLRRIAEGE